MRTDIILYDRIWLSEYIDRLSNQRDLARLIEYHLQRARMSALPELQMDYIDILQQVEELADSLEITERVLKDYLEHVQEAAIRLQNQCREIELPVSFK